MSLDPGILISNMEIEVIQKYVPDELQWGLEAIGEHEEGEIKIFFESDMEQVSDHLAKRKCCFSESGIYESLGKLARKKQVKSRSSARVKSKPSRLDI